MTPALRKSGAVPLTHAGLDAVENRRSADHVRGLLVAVGLLPKRDDGLARFDRWVANHLAEHAATAEGLKMLSLFAIWQLRPELVKRARGESVSDGQLNGATQRIRVAGALLAWLRARGRELPVCTQADVDAWFAPKLKLTRRQFGNAPVLNQAERLEILRRLLDPSTGSLEHRVAAMMLVLLGQPFTRTAALTLSNVVVEGEEVSVRLGAGFAPVPPPFAGMLTDLVGGRPNFNTASNPTSRFLFPGRSADEHLLPSTLRTAAIQMGIDITGSPG